MRLIAPLAIALCLVAALHEAGDTPELDLVIRNGRVVDGAGNPAAYQDVGIQDGRIAAVGRVTERGRREIDARGRIVAPGFIDVHTHAENVTSRPAAENFVRMGVTSIVLGNCGSSELDVAAFFRKVEETKVALNVATLFGHNTARRAAMGGSFNRAPTEEELDRMRQHVDQAMRDGAVGLSTGLIYLPGTFARTEEIVELAKAAAAHDGIYASHMRNEGAGIDAALNELFRVAREARIRAHVSHIKLGGKPAWGRAPAVLAALEAARAEGLDVTQDQYVYTASSTGLGNLVPASAREGGAARFRERLENPDEKARIIAQMKETLRRGGRESYDYAVIASYRADRSLNGKTIPEAAKAKRGADTLDDQIELILEIEQSGGGSGIYHGMDETDLQTFLRHPNTMIASDSGVRARDEGVPHPRGYGNNARVLGRYVRELKVLRLEDAVRRMTSLPAGVFGLRDRGLLRPGAWADVAVFDPEKVEDAATFSDPHHYARGVTHVLVNGVPVVDGGEQTAARPGMALRRR